MTEPSANSEHPSTRELGAGPGHWLRQEREARGLTPERVAAELHLAPALLEALEQDRYAELPAPVFVTGYLRNYARLLGLDPEPLLQAYRAASPALERAATRGTGHSARSDGSGSPLFRVATLVIVIGLLVLLGLWWQGRQGPLDITEVEETGPTAPALIEAPDDPPEVPQGPPRAPDEVPSAPDPAPDPPTDELPVAPAPIVEAPTSPSPPAAGDEAPAAPAPVEVVLVFDGPCWVDIRDATGEFKLFGEMGKGDRRVLGGSPPYSIIIGNAAAATIRIDGEPFDLASRARGNVARFTLDPTAAR
ncbi:RodZ domain-containing protein [Thiococcus pfennigii]|uniref:RodZ domain-containing protein n=2 Tax=Thiococcus pfennigii TaxID=1057 RepID=UPI001908D674|nr:RodZ domain-containing protein [Thiococcus pfennigii]MBK1730217.1 hypothetical protein [Thiococcus pfennigii]